MAAHLHGLFAYGSLLDKAAREHSVSVVEAHPVLMAGHRRGWYARIPDVPVTGLALVAHGESDCNGLLLHLTEEQLNAVDQRELPHGYERVEVHKDRLSADSPAAIPEGRVWTYCVRKPELPTDANPIAQSYLDVVLGGCLAVSDEFAVCFVQTTHGWDRPWINDRDRPLYVRSVRDARIEAAVDAILANVAPEALERRR